MSLMRDIYVLNSKPFGYGFATASFTTLQTDFGTYPIATSTTDTVDFTSTDASVTITGTSGPKTINFSVTGGRPSATGVVAATTSALAGSPVYFNGSGNDGIDATLTAGSNAVFPAQDGVTLIINDRLLVKDESNQNHNGIYTLTTIGSGSVKWVLTRATDSNTSAQFEAQIVVPSLGTTNRTITFAQTTSYPQLGPTTFDNIVYSTSLSGIVFQSISGTQIANQIPLWSSVTRTLTRGSNNLSFDPATNALIGRNSDDRFDFRLWQSDFDINIQSRNGYGCSMTGSSPYSGRIDLGGSNQPAYNALAGHVALSTQPFNVGSNQTLRFDIFPDGHSIFNTDAIATGNYGVVNIGSGAFDGSTTGKFVGSSNGTQLAINAASGFTGNLADIQVGGSKAFKIDANGSTQINVLGTSSINLIIKAISSQSGNLTEWQNSSGAVLSKVSADGSIYVASNLINSGPSTMFIQQNNSNSQMAFQSNGAMTSSNRTAYSFAAGTGFSPTSGDANLIFFTTTFAPTSGTSTFSMLNIGGTINQTGGASGITRGLYILPTITAAAEYRAIEIATGTVTTSCPLFYATQTWNNAAVTFNGIYLNVTGTAYSFGGSYATDSKFFKIELNGTQWFSIGENGSGLPALYGSNNSMYFDFRTFQSNTYAEIVGSNGHGVTLRGSTVNSGQIDVGGASIARNNALAGEIAFSVYGPSTHTFAAKFDVNGQFGIGISTPLSLLDVGGSLGLLAKVDSGTSLTAGNSATVIFTGSSATTWTLPALSTTVGRTYFIKNRGSANITLQRAGSDNLYDTASVTSITITPGQAFIVHNDGSFWDVM